MPMLKEGMEAPDFVLRDQRGKEHRLSDYRGKKVVVYFYPKDDTPGCTKEACGFRDDSGKIGEKNAVVLGISGDSVPSHKKFQDKYNLPFPLLSDPKREVIKRFGALRTKSLFGNTFLGIIRSTFVIDEKGRVVRVFPKVNPFGHSGEVLKVL